MSNKPWPEGGALVHFTELTEPVVRAIEACYSMQPREGILDKGVTWSGLDLGAHELAICFSPDEALSGSHLRYSSEDQGRSPLEEIIAIAVQLGIEQGRRQLGIEQGRRQESHASRESTQLKELAT